MNARPLITTEDFAAIVYRTPYLLPAITQTRAEAEALARENARKPALRERCDHCKKWINLGAGGTNQLYTLEVDEISHPGKGNVAICGRCLKSRPAADNVEYWTKWLNKHTEPTERTDGLKVVSRDGVVTRDVTDDTLAEAMRAAFPMPVSRIFEPAPTVTLDLTAAPTPFDAPLTERIKLPPDQLQPGDVLSAVQKYDNGSGTYTRRYVITSACEKTDTAYCYSGRWQDTGDAKAVRFGLDFQRWEWVTRVVKG